MPEQRCFKFKCNCGNPVLHIKYIAKLMYANPVTKLAFGDVRRDKTNEVSLYKGTGSKLGFICINCGREWESLDDLISAGVATPFEN